jgi:hypothetical protein
MIDTDMACGVHHHHHHNLRSDDASSRAAQPSSDRAATAGETFGGCSKSCAEFFCSSSCVKSYWHGGTHLCANGHHYT